MKRYFLTLCLSLIALAGCRTDNPVEDAEVTEVRLDRTKLPLVVGDSAPLTAKVLPEELSATTEVAWESSDRAVATVEADGTVTAIAVGAATVTAKAGGQVAFCTVEVSAREVGDVIVEPAEVLDLQVDATIQLKATVLPEDVEDKTVVWSSMDDDIVEVDENGLITAISKGTTTIVAKAGNQGGTCEVTVIGKAVESVTVEPESMDMKVDELRQLTVTVLPEDADNRSVTWTSSDNNIATVAQDGTVTAKAAGPVVITATAGEHSDVCNIEVAATPKVGDFYYSDGTFSASLSSDKTPIGVIFWTGDATSQDSTLKTDHPDCINGLVVALDGEVESKWQANADTYNKEVSPWVLANTSYKTVKVIGGGGDGDPLLNTISGYNNTKALEAFNAAPANSTWPVDAVAGLAAYRTDVPAPENSSDWYLPSPKELSLLCSGIYDGNIWDIFSDVDNRDFINNRLAMVVDTQQLSKSRYGLYISSAELSKDKFAGIYFSGGGGSTPLWLKSLGGPTPYGTQYTGVVRYVLAF